MVVLAPSTVQEIASFTMKAFDLADKYRMTAMILSDGILGQMMEPVEFADKEMSSLRKRIGAVTEPGKKEKENNYLALSHA
jgi:2-oxoglutarate ferredoxin oxidoreductase subunit alpha